MPFYFNLVTMKNDMTTSTTTPNPRLASILQKTRQAFQIAAASAALACAAGPAAALPVQINQSQFASQSAGLVVTSENFSGFPGMVPLGNSVVLANGTFTGNAAIVNDLGTAAGFCASPCLTTGDTTGDLRSFSLFPAGTQLWSAVLDMVFDFALPDIIHVEVLGNSGLLAFDVVGPNAQFLGFADPLGLLSVSFQHDLAQGGNKYNYSFDDVTTARTRANQIPEPSSLSLMLLALGAALAVQRRRQRLIG